MIRPHGVRVVVVLRAAALMVVMAVMRTASAQEAPPDAALVAAKAEFEEAQTLYIREAYGDAAAKFLAAYDKKPFGAFLFNAAVAFEKGQKFEQAIQFFEKYLEKEPQAPDAAQVKTRIEGLRALVAPATPAKPEAPTPPPAPLPRIETKGLVIIDSKPAGAVIYLDDKKGGVFARTPWQGSLPPKPVKIIVESKGFKPEERQISPRTDKVHEVYVALSEEHFLGWVEITSNVAGAEVFLDNREVGAIGRTPYTGHETPGKHIVYLAREGHVPVQKEIDVQPGTAVSHMITMEKVAVGWISVAGKQSRGGNLIVDGKPACETPCRHEVAPGRHTVEVEKDGFEDYEGEVEVARSAETEISINFSPKPPRTGAWSAAAVSTLFIAGGIYCGLQGKAIKKELERELAEGRNLDSADPRGDRGRYWYMGADVLFGVGALSAIVSAVNFLRWGPDSTAEVESKAIGFVPIGGGRGGMLVTRGAF
ncbi:MAG TPA: PEGA domain-containing protein [Polyangia bacterium]